MAVALSPRHNSRAAMAVAQDRRIIVEMKDRAARQRFADNLFVRCPPGIRRAVDELAAREMVSSSHYARRALLAQLQRDGVDIDALREATL